MIAVGLTVLSMLPIALGLFITLRFRYWISFYLYMEGRKKLSHCFGLLKRAGLLKKIFFFIFI